MYPIVQPGSTPQVGTDLKSFLENFDAICRDHIDSRRARTLSFIFYDFANKDFMKIIQEKDVFTELDRLSGDELTVFFLDPKASDYLGKFNNFFFKRLGINSPRFPCIVFFELKDGQITNANTIHLKSQNLIFGFHELMETFEYYIKNQNNNFKDAAEKPKYIQWIVNTVQFIAVETFRTALKDFISKVHF